MFSEKIEQRVYILEKQELEVNKFLRFLLIKFFNDFNFIVKAGSPGIPAPVYAELFASYLYRNDL